MVCGGLLFVFYPLDKLMKIVRHFIFAITSAINYSRCYLTWR